MTKWEYRKESTAISLWAVELNVIGALGWELIDYKIDKDRYKQKPHVYLFKRPIT